jgi:hypothetical protein
LDIPQQSRTEVSQGVLKIKKSKLQQFMDKQAMKGNVETDPDVLNIEPDVLDIVPHFVKSSGSQPPAVPPMPMTIQWISSDGLERILKEKRKIKITI